MSVKTELAHPWNEHRENLKKGDVIRYCLPDGSEETFTAFTDGKRNFVKNYGVILEVSRPCAKCCGVGYLPR